MRLLYGWVLWQQKIEDMVEDLELRARVLAVDCCDLKLDVSNERLL